MKTDTPKTIHRKDYTPPAYRIETTDLDVALGEENTHVTARLRIVATGDIAGALVLDGEHLELESIAIDGAPLPDDAYDLAETTLTLHAPPREFTLETVAIIQPQNNTALEGLYKSSGNFCTQCEAEGFRRITWYLDRPDALSVFTTRISGDKALYPVLLSNGNLTDSGDLDDGKHFAVWHDPVSEALLSVRLGRRQPCLRRRQLHDRIRPARSSCGSMWNRARRTAAVMRWSR